MTFPLRAGSLLARLLGGRRVVRALGDPGRLAAAIAQVIELGAPDLAAPQHLNRIDHRRIDRKDALDALAVGNLAHREVLVEAVAAPRDADAFVGLDAGALAFRDLDDDGVAGLERRNLGPGQFGRVLGLDRLDDVHVDLTPAVTPERERPRRALRRAVVS